MKRGDRKKLAWAGPGMTVAGVLLVAMSFAPGHLAAPDYTPEDAKRYQQTADRLHQLSGAAATATDPDPNRHRELADARAEFVELRSKLDAARSTGGTWTTAAKLGGAVLAVAGLLVTLFGGANRGA